MSEKIVKTLTPVNGFTKADHTGPLSDTWGMRIVIRI